MQRKGCEPSAREPESKESGLAVFGFHAPHPRARFTEQLQQTLFTHPTLVSCIGRDQLPCSMAGGVISMD